MNCLDVVEWRFSRLQMTMSVDKIAGGAQNYFLSSSEQPNMTNTERLVTIRNFTHRSKNIGPL